MTVFRKHKTVRHNVELEQDGIQAADRRVDKSIIFNLIVINQVDDKFILVTDSNAVYCLDQHAVDERIQLETLEEEVAQLQLCSNIPTYLVHSTFATTSIEASMIVSYKETLHSWGFQYKIRSENSIFLEALPIIDHRKLTVQDFRDYLLQLYQTPSTSKQLRPMAITKILQSRACRSAIMFGDKLTLFDCNSLLLQLRNCKFPFQCAHGRPSIVPIFSKT